MIIQKSLSYADLLLNKHFFLLSMFKTAVLGGGGGGGGWKKFDTYF